MDDLQSLVGMVFTQEEAIEGEVYKPKSNAGRPSVMTEQTLQKLREAFLMGCSDREACLFAEITQSTLYNYQKAHPEFLEQKDEWKENPILVARTTVYNNLKDPEYAKWYLERKKRDEFATRKELTGADGKGMEFLLDKIESDYDQLAEEAETALRN